jgi:hypothetical protein
MRSDTIRVWRWAKEQRECPNCRTHKTVMAMGLEKCPVCHAELRAAKAIIGKLGLIWLKVVSGKGSVYPK